MTELTEPDNVPAQPAPAWPQSHGLDIPDRAVVDATARLQEIPGLPAAGHEELYNRLHDELLAVLNDDSDGDASAAGNR